MQPETKFKNWLRPRLRAIKNSYWVKIQQKSIRGTPDFFGCIDGMFIALELKVGDNKLESLQSYNLHAIRRAKGISLEVHPDNVIQTLTTLFKLGGLSDESIETTKNTIGFSYQPKVRGRGRVRQHHGKL